MSRLESPPMGYKRPMSRDEDQSMRFATHILMLAGVARFVAPTPHGRALFGGDEPPVCAVCPADSWCPAGGARISCPSNTASDPGSFQEKNCTCVPGHHGTGGGDCTGCPEGFWCPGGSVINACPEAATSPLGSIQIDDCACIVRFHDHDGDYECLKCPIFASGVCSQCPDAPGVCCDGHASEHANSECIAGASNDTWVPCARCSCLSGFHGEAGQACAACPSGHWCPGDNVSNACPTGSSSPTGSDDLSDCLCHSGYLGTGGHNCTECPEGSYCPGGTEIHPCGRHAHSAARAESIDDCTCNTGYHDHDGDKECLGCPVYTDHDSTCTACPSVGAGTCCDGAAVAHSNSECAAGPPAEVWEPCAECVCAPGYFGSAGHDCAACPDGHWCRNGTQHVCTECPENVGVTKACTSSSDTVCVACPGNSTLPDGGVLLSECVCDPGFHADGSGECIACKAGEWCLYGQKSACPSISRGTINGDGLPICTCAPGFRFVPETAECAPCDPGAYCINGQESSLPASAAVNASDACSDSTAPPMGGTRAAQTVINSGSWFTVLYDHVRGNAFELTLYPGQYAEEYLEVCTWQGCVVMHHCEGGACSPVLQDGRKVFPFTTREVASVHLFIRGLDGDTSGKVTVLSTALLTFTAPCACSNRELLCPAQCAAEDNLKQTSFERCGCVDGYVDMYPDARPGLKRCFSCPTGAFCQNGTALSCPTDTETYVPGAADVSACECSPGKIGSQGACSPCPEGHYCQRGQPYICPHGFSTLATGSVSATECIGLLVSVSVALMEPYATLNVTWVPKIGGHPFVIGTVSANDTAVDPFVLRRFVAMADGKVHISAGVQTTDDVYTYCPIGGGTCSEIEAPGRGDCAYGLYTNIRVNPWRHVSTVTVVVSEGGIVPYCSADDCFSSFHPDQHLLVYTSDAVSHLNMTQVYGAPDGFHADHVAVFGTMTLRWHISAGLGYNWPGWEYRVASAGDIVCADGSATVEIQWEPAQDSEEGGKGGVLASTANAWNFDESFVSPGNIFVYARYKFSGSCSASVHMSSLEVSIREQHFPCLSLGDHQTTLPGTFHHTPAVRSARVIIDEVDIQNQGVYETTCRSCPKSFFCEGGEHIERCPANSDTSDVDSASKEDCLCDAGFTDGGRNATCSLCSEGTYKALDLSDAVCTACQTHEVTAEKGTEAEAECLCVPGFTGAYNATGCSPCAQGLYKDSVGNDPCTACPDFSSTVHTGSQSVGDCVCEPGYAPGPEGCSPCPPGTFKSLLSNHVCSPCPLHTYNPRTASVSDSACNSCPVGTLGLEEAMVSLEQCEQCPEDSYLSSVNGTRVCVACRDYSTAPTGSLARENCTCRPGFFPEGGQCEPCRMGTRKDLAGDHECTPCPAGTFEPRNGSTASACLQCPMGTYQPETGSTSVAECLFCPRGTYGTVIAAPNHTDCAECPQHATSEPGSTLVQQCSCERGYFTRNGTCTPCDKGYYKDFIGDSVCVPCPSRTSTTGQGSTSISQCLCDVGYFGTELGCAPCPVSEFKDTVSGAANCTRCPEHQTTLKIASESRAQCVCDTGAVETNYNETTMQRTCSSCPDDSYQTEVNAVGFSACRQCFQHATAGQFAPSVDACQCGGSFIQQPWYACECAAGAFLNASACSLCPVGQYSTRNNTDLACTQCKPFSSTAGQGGVSPEDCDCIEDFEEDANGTCVCVPGMELQGQECAECTLSEYKERGMSACAACPQYSRTVVTGSVSITNCSCFDTFVGDSVSGCVCDKGHRFAIGPARCEPCPMNFYRDSRGLHPACTACPAHSVTLSTAAPDASECLCVPGHGFDNASGTCHPCAPGTYSDSVSLDACVPCPENMWSPIAAQGCFCVPGYAAVAVQNATVTPVQQQEMSESFNATGTGAPSAQCTPCPRGAIKTDFENTGCVSCSEHENTHTNGVFDSPEDCQCVAGYFRNGTGGPCHACPMNSYKDVLANSASCSPCKANSVTNSIASVSDAQCVCGPGAEPTNETECGLCGTDAYKTDPGNAVCARCPTYTRTGAPGAARLEDCECLPSFLGNITTGCMCSAGSFVLPLEERCEQCPVGTYRGAASTAEECIQCPANATTLATGSVSLQDDCVCAPGLTMNETSLECHPCESGTYKPHHSGVCMQCPAGTLSQTGAVSIADCMCPPGNQPVNDSTGNITQCEPCPVNTYKGTISNEACGGCPMHSQPLPGTGNTFCVPSAGYYLKEETIPGRVEKVRAVTPCEEGTYKETVGDTLCTPCPELKESEEGSDSLADCTCIPGKLANNNGDCAPCPSGHYCPGKERKIDCPVSSTSDPGADDVSDCVCGRGYNFTGTTCVPCPANFFKDRVANIDCTRCNEESTGFASFTSTCSLTAQKSRLDCRRPQDCSSGGDVFTPAPRTSAALRNSVHGRGAALLLLIFAFAIECIYVL